MGRRPVHTHQDLEVYKLAYDAAMELFRATKRFPAEERYSLTSQVPRSSRSVCANLAEAWRKRRYKASFLSKLSDAEAEAAETQTWVAFAKDCGYLAGDRAAALHSSYDQILGKLVALINRPDPWLLPGAKR